MKFGKDHVERKRIKKTIDQKEDQIKQLNRALRKAIDQKEDQIKQLNESIASKDAQLKQLTRELKLLQDINSNNQKAIDQKEDQIKQLNEKNKDMERIISNLESHNTALGKRIAMNENELSEIKSSIIFGILRQCVGFIDRLLPPNTSRRELVRLSRTAMLVRRQEGTYVMLQEIKKRIFASHSKKKIYSRSIDKIIALPDMTRQLQSLHDSIKLTSTDIKEIVSPVEGVPKEDKNLRQFLIYNSTTITKLQQYPLISIIISTYNNLGDLKQNILSIETKTTYPNYEIIIITNNLNAGSPMRKYLSSIQHKVYVYEEEYSFSSINNFGALKANGELFLFLNDDTEVAEPQWLEALVKLALYPSTGAVGGKIVYPDGTLQEAGGIVWGDGNAWNYGKYAFDASDLNVNFVREVDYCSGAFLLVKKSVFNEVGGFDAERYSPAYWEDVDLCFAIRDRGYSVLYQPLSTIIHKEGATQGRDESKGLKAYQPINRGKFLKKWGHKIQGRLTASYENTFIERSRRTGKRILYIDHYIPEPDQDSGSLRTFYILGILSWFGHNVTFWPDNLAKSIPYALELQQRGIEVVYGPHKFESFLESRGKNFDIIILSRPYIAIKYIDTVQKYSPASKIIYDTVDLHYVRLLRQAFIENDPDLAQRANNMKEMEMGLIKSSSFTIVVSKKEAMILKNELNSVNIIIIPNIHFPKTQKDIPSFKDRKNILFVGGFQHMPNVDAVLFFVNEIFPLLKREIIDLKLLVVGSRPPDCIKTLASDDIVVTGYVPDITPYLERSKVMVAPLRYGAGVKGKITESMSFGLPVVTTSVGAEGLDTADGESILVADSPKEFASKVIRIYTNKDLWNRLSANSFTLALKRYSPENILEMLKILFSS